MQRSPLDLPALSPRYDGALRAAIKYIFDNFEPFAVIVSGSIVRGNPDPSSDFDIVVLHEQSWRRRVQRRFEGVPAEIFVNSPAWMERYFAQEAAEGRPIMAHMLTTGMVVFSSSDRTGEIVQNAHESVEHGPNFSEAALERQRYSAACLYEDAFEVAGRDAAAMALILSRAVEATVNYWFASRQQFLVRAKDQMDVIRAESPETALLIERTLLASGSDQRLAAACELAQSVIGHTGFFEWDSGPDEPETS